MVAEPGHVRTKTVHSCYAIKDVGNDKPFRVLTGRRSAALDSSCPLPNGQSSDAFGVAYFFPNHRIASSNIRFWSGRSKIFSPWPMFM